MVSRAFVGGFICDFNSLLYYVIALRTNRVGSYV